MKQPRKHRILVSLLTTLISVSFAGGVRAADELPPPPYLVSRAHIIVVGAVFDEATIEGLLGPGLQGAPGGTGGIIIYQVGEAYGLPPYSSYWIWADVEGHDSASGVKARWMLTGAYSPAAVPPALKKHFGYPAREGQARIEWSGASLRATGSMASQDILHVELKRKTDPCQRVSGTVNEVTQNGGSPRILVNTVTYVGDFCLAESAQVEVTAPANDPFGKLKPVKILWAGEVRDAAFAWVAGK